MDESYELFELDTSVVPSILGFTAAAILLIIIYFCLNRLKERNQKNNHKLIGCNFKPNIKPKAVRSPNGQPPQHFKKTPSPTVPSKLLPGVESPTAEQQSIPNLKTVKYTEENEKKKPDSTVVEKVNTNGNADGQENENTGLLGTLVFKLRYFADGKAFVVSIVRCRGLPVKNANNSEKLQASTDPYIKLQLLPDKQHKVKTRVVRKTRNPVYDEDFTFYGLSLSDLNSMSLHFVVLSFDRYSRDDIIGEVVCPLSSVSLQQIENQQVAISKEIQPRSLKIKLQGRGELLLSLCWQPAASRLTVVLLKARNLPRMDVTGLADPYVKIYLLYNGQRISKKKTHVKKRTLNPVFNESFAFDIPPNLNDSSLQGVSIELMLLDWDRVTKNEVIGKLELGGPNCVGTALNHWTEVCNSPRRQIAEWHKLNE